MPTTGYVLTVTPAPAIDWTMRVARLEVGGINRARGSTREAAGKGVNVSAALHAAGVPTTAVLPVGGPNGRLFASLIADAGFGVRAFPVAGELRTNLTVLDGVRTTKLNDHPAELTVAERDGFVDAVLGELADARLVLLCGSLPTSLGMAFYAELADRIHRQAPSLPVWVDTSGPVLRAALAGCPDLIKPNTEELADLVGSDLLTIGDVLDAARAAAALGAGSVLVSLGADGALLVGPDSVLHGTAPRVAVANTVGAGDALLAGFAALDADPATRLVNALVWSGSAVQSPTTRFVVDETLRDRIRLDAAPDLSGTLAEPTGSTG